MNSSAEDDEKRLVGRVADSYKRDGYRVVVSPVPADVPVDLGGYTPDLLATKGRETLAVEVKASSRPFGVDRYREIAKEIATVPGWRFVLVTSSDVTDDGENDLPSPDVIRERVTVSRQLREQGHAEASFLVGWIAVEGVLRTRAAKMFLPVDRMAVPALAKHLYSQGELSADELQEVLGVMPSRNRVVHGFVTPAVDGESGRIERLLYSLMANDSP